MTTRLWVVLTTPVVGRDDYLHVLPDHLRYQKKLESDGVLFAAGPLLTAEGERTGRGLIILKATTAEEAAAIADGDPLHAGGFRIYTLDRWSPREGEALQLLPDAGAA